MNIISESLEIIATETQKQSKGKHLQNRAYCDTAIIAALYHSLNSNESNIIQYKARLSIIPENSIDIAELSDKLFLQYCITALENRNKTINDEIEKLKYKFT